METIDNVPIDLRGQIDKIRFLQLKYETCVKASHANSSEAINVYHNWYNKAAVIFRRVIGSNDADVSEFKDVNNSGNGYTLQENYHKVLSSYSILMDKLEQICSGKTQSVVRTEMHESGQPYGKLVFISHASKDKAIIDIFVTYILRNGLNLQSENIVFTSFEETGVPIGDNIPQYIKENIGDASVVLSMVSQNYKASEVCQNEVGAAFALDKTPIQIMLPDTDFSYLGWLIHLDKAARIDSRESLDNLMGVLCQRLGINQPKIGDWNGCVTRFLEQIERVSPTVNDKRADIDYDVTFADGTNEMVGTPEFKHTQYMETKFKDVQPDWVKDNPFIKACQAMQTAVTSYNNYAVRIPSMVEPIHTKTDKSRVPVDIVLRNIGNLAIDDVTLYVTSHTDGVTFFASNVTDTLRMPSLDEYNRYVKDEEVTCCISQLLTESSYKIDTFYLFAPAEAEKVELTWRVVTDNLANNKQGTLSVRLNCQIVEVNTLFDDNKAGQDLYEPNIVINDAHND